MVYLFGWVRCLLTIIDLGQFATFLISVLVTWTSARTKDRSIHIICLMLVAAVGNAIATGTTNVGARFFAMFLMPMGAVSACTWCPHIKPASSPAKIRTNEI